MNKGPSMEAVCKTGRGKGLVEIRRVDRPGPGAGEALIRVVRAAVCGTDLRPLSAWREALDALNNLTIIRSVFTIGSG